MPTKWTQTLIPTARKDPADAEVPSHKLLIRAGLIRKLGAGVYDYLPLGLRSLQKVMRIIREEMAAAGAIEVFLPTLHPIELWEQTGRRTAYGENLFVVKDRHGRLQALGPTHEEVITELVGAFVESYKQLPLTLYQIQTKFRDEFRPRFGILRSREFQMKDAYSFHLALDGPPGSGSLNETYQKQYDAYCRIFTRCGLPFRVVEAESGPIGGSASHEFMVPSPTGEDTILESDKANYAANIEKCEIGVRLHSFEGPPTGELDKVSTPNCPGIEDVGKLLKVKPKNMLKTLVFFGVKNPNDANQTPPPSSSNDCRTLAQQHRLKIVVAVVRGDHEVNEAKLRHQFFALNSDFNSLSLADPAAARELGFTIGYVGPQVIASSPLREHILLIADPDAAQPEFFVTGANESDHHVRHFNWGRDVLDVLGAETKKYLCLADIRNAVDGDPSPKNDGGILRTKKGIEIGHVFKLGDKYTKAMNISVLDEKNQRRHPIMGCYGIGVNRILAGAIERDAGHDDNGIVWPAAIAPYSVLITPIQYDGQMKQTADQLADQLEASLGPNEILIDDRAERPGVKFKDADLVGIPLRITIGEKALADGKVEIKPRKPGSQVQLVPIDQAAAKALEMLKSL